MIRQVSGNPSVFELKQIEKASLRPSHVIIKVLATSVNQIDCKIRSGAVAALAPSFLAGQILRKLAEVVEHHQLKLLIDPRHFTLETVDPSAYIT